MIIGRSVWSQDMDKTIDSLFDGIEDVCSEAESEDEDEERYEKEDYQHQKKY